MLFITTAKLGYSSTQCDITTICRTTMQFCKNSDHILLLIWSLCYGLKQASTTALFLVPYWMPPQTKSLTVHQWYLSLHELINDSMIVTMCWWPNFCTIWWAYRLVHLLNEMEEIWLQKEGTAEGYLGIDTSGTSPLPKDTANGDLTSRKILLLASQMCKLNFHDEVCPCMLWLTTCFFWLIAVYCCCPCCCHS